MIDERIEEVSGLILVLGLESHKLVTEKSNPAETAERYVACYEIVERIILLLFDYLDIPVKAADDAHDGESIHGALLRILSSERNPFYPFLGQGPSHRFLKEANYFRGRWRNRPRKDTSVLNNTPTRLSMAEGFKEAEESLRSALHAIEKEVKRRKEGHSLWDVVRTREIALAMKEEDLQMKERKLEKWEEEGEPRKEKIMNEEKELERAKEVFKKQIEAFRVEKAEHQDQRILENEELAEQRYDNAKQLRLCRRERENDYKELEEELSKLEKTKVDLQVQHDVELEKAKKELENEISKTKHARTALEANVDNLLAMVVSYRTSRMPHTASGEDILPTGRVEDKLTLMITRLLADLTQAEVDKDRLKAEKGGLWDMVYDLQEQLGGGEQSAGTNVVSSDGERTNLSGSESGGD